VTINRKSPLDEVEVRYEHQSKDQEDAEGDLPSFYPQQEADMNPQEVI